MQEFMQLISLHDALDDTEEMSWQERALCAQTDPEAFFHVDRLLDARRTGPGTRRVADSRRRECRLRRRPQLLARSR